MVETSDSKPGVDRRRLLQGWALFAGAAGVAAVAHSPAAEAATGDPIVAGAANSESTSTTVTVSPGRAPAVSLVNTDGPQLRLGTVPDEWGRDVEVHLGDIVNTAEGPLVGADYGGIGVELAPLLTPNDVQAVIPIVVPSTPERILDTRTSAGRESIVRTSSPDALSSDGMLKAGQWIDIWIDDTSQGYISLGYYYNVTVVGPAHAGHMSVVLAGLDLHRPPDTSTVNFQPGVNLANGGFIEASPYKNLFVVRLWTSVDTHLLWDLTGAVVIAASNATGSDARRAALHAARAQLHQINAGRSAARRKRSTSSLADRAGNN